MNRWIRLSAAVVAMMMIANLQYTWTLFVHPLMGATHSKLSEVQLAFTIFIALETWSMSLSGWLIDRFGPRLFLSIAGILCGIGWASLGQAHTLTALYAFYALAGFGAAMVYCGSTSIGLKWFPDRRGLAAGTIAAGFGSGAAFFVFLIAYLIRERSYSDAFLYTGIAQGLLIVAAAQFLQNPRPGSAAAVVKKAPANSKTRRHTEDFTSLEMLRTPQFYVLYLVMTMMGVGGLMVTAQLAPVAATMKIGMTVLTLALTLNPIANGASRLSWGWVSDHVGRERTMAVAFLLQSISLVSVLTLGRRSSLWFIVCLVLVYFTWGEIYSLFPATCADYFGSACASSNYSFLYSSKGTASIVGGWVAATLFEKTGSWSAVFYGSAVLALISAIIAFQLRKMPLPTKAAQRQSTQPQSVRREAAAHETSTTASPEQI
jgi:OFA family oxalate/formate antiporter-like MFS transporter